MKHTIKYEELEDFVINHEISGSYGKGSHKTLNCVIPVTCSNHYYEVLEKRKLVFKTFDLKEAIEKYNELN